MTKHMADLHRINSLQEKLRHSKANAREAELRARESESKLDEKNMNNLIKQAEADFFQLWSQLKR